MHLSAEDELSLEWSKRDNFLPFYGGPNNYINWKVCKYNGILDRGKCHKH